MSEIDDLIATLGRWWEDPEQTGLRRLPARTTTTASPDDDAARSGESPWVHDLAGEWAFRLVDRPEAAPAGWTTRSVNRQPTLEVPGNWTMQGTGDLPHYTNVVMPWAGEPPSVPAENPTGLYRRDFVRPRGWAKRRTILHLGAAESTAAVWCNGTFVGFTTDSRLPAEFDLTPHVTNGVNALAVMVIRWSAATWVEDQDHWFHAGLHRRVFLRSAGRTSLADVQVAAELAADLVTGELAVTARVDGPSAGWTVQTQLESLGGRAVRGGRAAAPVSQFDDSSHFAAMLDAYRHPGPEAATSVELSGVKPWSHEDPNRYRVLVRLVDPDGVVHEVVPVVVGFRRVEVVGAELLLNGAVVPIAGVNRHDHSHVHGKALTDEEMRADVLNIKRCGFNAVRTSHYPPDPVVIDTCDEIGLWVVCEANVESHGRWEEVANDPVFERAFFERVQRMVAIHRNHVSIMGWSLGNEAGYGAIHDAGAAWVRAVDSTRFVQYEGGVMWRFRDFQTDDFPSSPSTDIECPMYAPVPSLVKWATETTPDRPLILCEYSHAMGNSNGGLADYWAAFDRYHGLQGGFIWDWRDQGLVTHDAEGREFFGYGGAFGDEPNDAAFCCNGIVGPDGEPHPAVEEHRWLTREVRTELVSTRRNHKLRVTNRRAFSGLDDLVGLVTVEVDGRVVKSAKVLAPEVAPGGTVDIPIDMPTGLEGTEAFVTVRWAQRRATEWADAGHVISWDQTALRVAAPHKGAAPAPAELDITVDDRSGLLTSARHDGRELLAAPPVLALWRAPTDNDGVLVGPGAGISGATARWLQWGLDRLERTTVSVERRGRRRFTAVHRWSNDTGIAIDHRQRISFAADGSLHFAEEVDIPVELDDLPRVGVRFSVPSAFDRLEWFGPGPWETAVDRLAAPVGRWGGSVAGQYVPYVTPQHHGTHVDTRWFTLTDGAGHGLRLDLDGLAFDASHHRVADLTAAATTNLLAPTPEVHVHIDAALRGVGTDACGPDTTEFVRGGRFRFSWRLRPMG